MRRLVKTVQDAGLQISVIEYRPSQDMIRLVVAKPGEPPPDDDWNDL